MIPRISLNVPQTFLFKKLISKLISKPQKCCDPQLSYITRISNHTFYVLIPPRHSLIYFVLLSILKKFN